MKRIISTYIKTTALRAMAVALPLMAASGLMTSCSSDDDPFFTATEDDYPRILNTDIPEWSNGEPGTIMSIERTANFKFDVIVTPVHYTTVTWLIDDEQVAEGNSIDMPLLAGNYILKIVATTTKGLQTSRTCRLIVRPSEGDPVPGDAALERLVAPGTKAVLHGTNMDKVRKVIINGQEATATYRSSDGAVEYTVPAGLADGTYPLTVADAAGTIYGGGRITVSSSPSVSASEFTGKSEGELTISGQNLDKVAKITIDGKECTIVAKKSSELTFKAPKLAAGSHEMKATDASGQPVKFVNGSAFSETATFIVTAETTLWEGTHAVDWSTPFEDAAATEQLKATAKVGSVLRLYVKRTASDYCMACATVNWANICTGATEETGGRGDIVFDGEQVLEYTLNAKSFELLGGGNLQVVGHGFDLLRVTVE